ncbi:hypothetical protein [Flavihumibacter fluvii]|uniref:hypothetical protein n=1 Tax=Flavihumibacter fluvii TaxID=2838157 RepID=UPI001BDE0983|nr:hypothetical protein [Flavihumibacter fluvii]ULQ54109.1 hypothetical protein KJS93_07225 [Flavihumibacter fluvii]
MFQKAGKAGILLLLSFFILALVVLACLNFPQSDDYMLFLLNSKYGFWGLQEWIYHNNTGRYFSSFAGAVFQQKNFLYEHYAIHSVVLILGNVAAFYVLLRTICHRLFNYRPGRVTLLIYSALLFLTSLNICPDARADLYWFSSSVTYRLPFILSLFLVSVFIHLILDGYTRELVIILVLILMIMGSNELSAATTGISILYFLFSRKKTIALSARKSWIIAVAVALCLAIVFLGPGAANRRNNYLEPELLTTFPSFIYWISVAFWNICKSPLFLFLCMDIFFLGITFRPEYNFKATLSNKTLFGFLAIQCLALGIVVHFVHGSLAARTLNVFASSFFLWALVGVWKIAAVNSINWDARFLKAFNNYKYLVYGTLLLFSQFSADISQSLFSGYYLHKAYQERMARLATGAGNGQKEVQIPSYAERLRDYSVPGNKKLLQQMMSVPPKLLYDFDPQEETMNYRHLCNYFHLDKITVDGQDYLKIDIR